MAWCCAVFKVFIQDQLLMHRGHRRRADLWSPPSSLVLGGSVGYLNPASICDTVPHVLHLLLPTVSSVQLTTNLLCRMEGTGKLVARGKGQPKVEVSRCFVCLFVFYMNRELRVLNLALRPAIPKVITVGCSWR